LCGSFPFDPFGPIRSSLLGAFSARDVLLEPDVVGGLARLVVFLDRAGYFYARDVWEFVSGKRETTTIDDTSITCVDGEKLDLWYFPPKLPELNPVEGCWNQLQEWFSNRFVKNLHQLKRELVRGVKEISVPNIWNYLCSSQLSGK